MEDRIFAVIDTNVLVSALLSPNNESPPLTVMANVFAGTITPVYNNEIIDEYRSVLKREKFHFDPVDVEAVINVFLQYGLNLERTEVNGEAFQDPKDIVFYEVKMSKDDAYLITGNTKHFPKQSFVITPREMVDILLSDHGDNSR